MSTVVLPAHFNGQETLLDEPYDLEANTALIVTVLPKDDKEREEWLLLSGQGLAEAYSDDEPEYTLDMIKEWNPLYDGR